MAGSAFGLEAQELPVAATDEAGLAVEFGDADIGVAGRLELAADLAGVGVLDDGIDDTGTAGGGVRPGKRAAFQSWMSAEVTALPTVISSEIESLVGTGCGTVPVATERSTLALLNMSRPPATQPERVSTPCRQRRRPRIGAADPLYDDLTLL
jgi:hypothetical protein